MLATKRLSAIIFVGVLIGAVMCAMAPPALASASTQAGYTAGTTTSHPFASVSATAKIPNLSCPSTQTQQVVWDADLHDIFGGAAGNQSSAQTLMECFNKKPVYAFAAISFKAGVGETNFTVFSFKPKAGDVVTESVTTTASASIVRVVDHTTGASGSKTYPRFAAVNAEVALLQQPTPVPSFGSMPFTQVKVNGVGMGTQPHLLKSSTTKISVSTFSAGGTAFTCKHV